MNKIFDLQQHTHRRLNILTGEYVLVAPHRTKRPWQGQVEDEMPDTRPQYDEKCYLCPGNVRSGGAVNPEFKDTFIFRNDFSSLSPDSPAEETNENDLLVAKGERGDCYVLCFSPRHDLTLPEMDQQGVRKVVDAWTQTTQELSEKPTTNYVVVFENKGAMMGCSNPHPHCQIWACDLIPQQAQLEITSFKKYAAEKHNCLLCDYMALEMQKKERIVVENDGFVVMVPFWAMWPYEVILISKKHLGNFMDFSDEDKDLLADILRRITIRYDNLFRTSFPYSMGFHQTPFDGKDYSGWHFHAHFYPPLLRSATIRKFMVGFEMLGTPMRDISPEFSAQRLREMSEVHFRQK